jgi:hypothetical protein
MFKDDWRFAKLLCSTARPNEKWSEKHVWVNYLYLQKSRFVRRTFDPITKHPKIRPMVRAYWRLRGRLWEFWCESAFAEKKTDFFDSVKCLFGLIKWVNVYVVTRHYGGPEEGGWWFDWNECVHSEWFISRKRARACIQKLRLEYIDEGDISSVLGGEEYWFSIERLKAESQDTELPHYC